MSATKKQTRTLPRRSRRGAFTNDIQENRESAQKKQKRWVEQVARTPGLPTKSVHYGGGGDGESYPDAGDDYVLALVQRVYDEFTSACACTLLSFWRPKRRTLWHVTAKSVVQLRDVIEMFVSGPGGHTLRREYFMSIVKECHELPEALSDNGAAARMFETYSPKMQFMMVFTVPFTRNQLRRKGIAKGSKRSIVMEVILPMTDTDWSEEVHRCLPPPTKERIDTVLTVIREAPLDCTSPFLSMPTDVLKNIFTCMLEDDPDVASMVKEPAKCTQRTLNSK